MPHDRYRTVHEVADLLKVNEATVRHWIRDGELRAIDIGKGWRIADADLVDFFHHHETRPRDGNNGRGQKGAKAPRSVPNVGASG
jgi:excisionase family DNA binding protein